MSTTTTTITPTTASPADMPHVIRLRRNARRRLSTPAPIQTHRLEFCHPFPPSLEALDLSASSSPTQILASLRFLVLSYLAELEQRLFLLESPYLEKWHAKSALTIEEARQWAQETLEMLESLRNDVCSHLPDIHLSDITVDNFKAHLPEFPDVPSISNMRAHLPDVPSIHDVRSHLPDLPDCISSKLDNVRTKFNDIDFHTPIDYVPILSQKLESLQLHLSSMELPIGLPGSHSMLSDLVDSLLSSELVSDFLQSATPEDDVFERAAREVTRAVKQSFQGVHLITYADLPEPWKNNSFVTQGYRFIPVERWPLIFLSLFAFHNEFLNIHTHLIPGLLWLINCIPFVNPSGIEDIPEALFMAFAIVCLFSSAVWHTMAGCAHCPSMEFCARIDYVGIGWLISASVGTVVHYGFQCFPRLGKIFLAGCFLTGLLGNICPFMSWFNEVRYRGLRIVFFLSLAFFSLAPLAGLAIMHSPKAMASFISPVVPSLVSYIIGLVFYATHIPERFIPEKWSRYLDRVGGDDNPLASSTYDGLDPWSGNPSPTTTPAPQAAATSVFSSVIADATVPSVYSRAFAAVDPANTGETSVNSLSRVLATSSLPAATVDKIVNLVSSKPRVSKLEFFVALALVSLAQSGKDVSIEQVAALSSQNELPEPTLDLDSLQPSLSTFSSPGLIYRQDTAIRSPAPQYSADDPWDTTARFVSAPPNMSGFDASGNRGVATGGLSSGAPSTVTGTGLSKEWWKKQKSVNVTIQGQQGFILNRYTVYQISTDRGPSVIRRYSEFVFLWDCIYRRYPFRLFPALPPKRIGSDEYFLEQRRRGLARCLAYLVNHPVIKDDGVLAAFLTEISFEEWRKHASVTLDEESASKRVERSEEMTIPSDLEDKITTIRRRVIPLIEQWQRICVLAERIIKRREAAAVRIPSPFRRPFTPAHLLHNKFTSSAYRRSLSDSASITSSTVVSISGLSIPSNVSDPSTLNNSMIGSLLGPDSFDVQSDLSRLTNTLRAVIEVGEPCWRGDECELSSGVRAGLQHVVSHCQRHSEVAENRTRVLLDTTLEALKTQRDLYIAVRDLFIRHDRLSLDQVERLKKRVETTSHKLDGIKTTQKDGWQDESDKLVAAIEKDQATIAAQLSRRIFIRACLWHELRVILHNRENALLTVMVQAFGREEQDYTELVLNNWASLSDAVEGMPFE
ncbi:hypothetical protein D9757_005774 [Collybiopsis confluens]|uniref:Sorting nexin MVP1 n=1 Tax=Collybiopsis confluens TaxID=2823264 RepID=A0A8H5HPW0_9AGAR|nr:hypothetical protein D9757_005774 [Collybiopsis confluens]